MKQPAFKEWDSVVRALGRGRQAVILRKGGIHEEKNLFKVRHQSFLLFPTFEHQVSDDLTDEGRIFLEASIREQKDPQKTRILYSARLEKDWYVNDFKVLEKLSGFHVFSAAGVKKKFEWGSKEGLSVLLVRVYRLPRLIEISNLPQYGGCRSWLEIETPHSETSQALPVVEEGTFQSIKAELSKVLITG